MLIGFNGRLKSGKDTAYSIIKELYPEAERASFAAKLKESAAASIGVDIDTLESLKSREDLFFELLWTDARTKQPINDAFTGRQKQTRFNVRQYLQWYGTEGHRDVFGDNFWVDQALPLDLDHTDRLIIVTDMRFPNEAQRVLDLGGITAKVEREVATEHSAHASEQDIDHMIEYVIDNTGTLDDYREAIRAFLSAVERNASIPFSVTR